MCKPRPDIPFQDSKNHELLAALGDRGWLTRSAPSTKAQRAALPPHSQDSVCKVWYAIGLDLNRCRQYLLALLLSPELFAAGHLHKVHRFQNKSYYVRILNGKSTGALEPMPAVVEGPAGVTLDDDVADDLVVNELDTYLYMSSVRAPVGRVPALRPGITSADCVVARDPSGVL